MLVVGGGDEAAFGSLQGVFSCLTLGEPQMAVRRGDHRSNLPAVYNFRDRDTGLGQRRTGHRIYGCSRNPKRLGGWRSVLWRSGLMGRCNRGTGQQQDQSGHGKDLAAEARGESHCESPLEMIFRRRCSFWPAATRMICPWDSKLRSASWLAYAKSSCRLSKASTR